MSPRQYGRYKVSYFAKETGQFELLVKGNEEFVRGNLFDAEVKLRQFKAVLSFGQGPLKKPWGVVVKERNEIAVTDTRNKNFRYTVVYSSDGIFLRLCGRKGDQLGELSSWNSF